MVVEGDLAEHREFLAKLEAVVSGAGTLSRNGLAPQGFNRFHRATLHMQFGPSLPIVVGRSDSAAPDPSCPFAVQTPKRPLLRTELPFTELRYRAKAKVGRIARGKGNLFRNFYYRDHARS